MSNLFLVEPCVDYKYGFLAMVKDYEDHEDEVYFNMYKEAIVDFDSYTEKLLNESNNIGLASNRVPSSTYWLVNEDCDVLGVIRIRHHLGVEHLRKYVGHIGYDISPSNRKNGYGELILKLGIEKAKDMGISSILVTCSADNIGSRRVIEKNNGDFEYDITDPNGIVYKRYWI